MEHTKPLEGTIEIPTMDVVSIVDKQLEQYDLPAIVQKAQELAIEYDKPVTNNAELESHKLARRKIRNERLNLSKVGAYIKKQYYDMHKQAVKLTDEAVESLKEPEDLIDSHIKAYEKAIEDARIAKEQEAQRIIAERYSQLNELGFEYRPENATDMARYELSGTTIYTDVVVSAGHEEWATRYSQLRMVSEDHFRKLEEERIAQEQKELAEAKEKKEMEEALAIAKLQVGKLRKQAMDAVYQNTYTPEDLGGMTEEKFTSILQRLVSDKKLEAEKEKALAEEQERKKMNTDRIIQLEEAGARMNSKTGRIGVDVANNWDVNTLANLSDDQFTLALAAVRSRSMDLRLQAEAKAAERARAELKATQDREEAEKKAEQERLKKLEQEALAQRDDIQIMKDLDTILGGALEAITTNGKSIKSEIAKHAVRHIIEKLNGCRSNITGTIEDLSKNPKK